MPQRDHEWLIFQDEARRIYQSDSGGRRVEWATAGHRNIRGSVPFLREIKNTSGTFTPAQASAHIRLLAEVVLSLISVALRQDNPEEDPMHSIPQGEDDIGSFRSGPERGV